MVLGDEPDPEPGPGDPATPVTLRAGNIEVDVAEEFPQVIDYRLGDSELAGQPATLDTFRINGTDYTAETILDQGESTDSVARYVSTLPELGSLEINSSISVDERGLVKFRIDEITGPQEPEVNQIAIPGHSLAAVDSSQADAQLARTTISTNSTTTADRFVDITDGADTDAEAVLSPYAFLSGGGLAAGVFANATPDVGGSSTDQRLVTKVSESDDDTVQAEVRAGTWTWAPDGAVDERVARYDNPEAIVVVSADRNDNSAVDWQDAALLLRDVLPAPHGADRYPNGSPSGSRSTSSARRRTRLPRPWTTPGGSPCRPTGSASTCC